MKSAGIYSLKQERLWVERQQAVIRLLLTLVTALVLIKFYNGQTIPGYEDTSRTLAPAGAERVLELTFTRLTTLISMFAVYSVGIWALIRWFPNKLRIITALASLVEIVLITYLFSTTAWTGIPFYLWYFFYVVSVATRYGWLHSILALSASIVSFTWVATVTQNSASDLVPVLGFTGFLLVLAMMFGQISEKQLNYQASLAVVNEFRADLAGLATSRGVIDLLLERVGELLNVEHAFFLPAKRGADGSEAPGLRSVGTNPVMLAAFREDGDEWNVEAILNEQRPLASNNLYLTHPLPEGAAAKLGIRNLAAAPLIVRGAPVGVVYAANRRDKSLRASDLQLLALVATQAAPVVENALLWERLNEAATSEERLRIARDLHDNFLQTLAAIKLHLERCKILVEKDTERAKDGIDKIHQIATRGLAEVRYYLSELRLMGPEPSRFREAIKKVADEAALRGGFEAKVDVDLLDSPIPPGAAVAAFQIVRELLNNAAAHAQAKHVTVAVRAKEGFLVMEISDDGVGFEVERVRAEKVAQGHLGLVGIEERAQHSGGTFELTSEPGKGTQAIATMAI